MKKSANLEFKVGVFVFLGLGILAWLVIRAGDFKFAPGYTVRLLFPTVAGIEAGSSVRLAGVPVGEVRQIEVIRDETGRTQVEITAWIDQRATIEEDAEVRINSLGLLGEKYIEITPGAKGRLGGGGVIAGKMPADLDKITDTGHRLLTKIEFTVDNINEVVSDPSFKDSVRGTFGKAEKTFANSEVVMTDLREVSGDLKDAARSARIVMARLRDGEGSVGRLLKDDTIARDLEAFVKDIKAHPWKLLKRN
jgi:phospholipid/cholesterol/gamma-HCH transport system substrate-binding protein